LKKFVVGNIEIAIINYGDLRFWMKELENVAEKEQEEHPDIFAAPHIFPCQSFLISTAEGNIMVDPGNYTILRAFEDFETYVPPNYTPPPDLETQLKSLGKETSDISSVIITHAHFDHYCGVTKRANSEYVPAFPNAKYFLGKADWEDDRLRRALDDANSGESLSLGKLYKAGKLELVSGTKTLSKEVEIIPSPGESPGHQIVSVHSGESLYCVGDLFHHAVEVEKTSWMAPWSDLNTSLESRRKLIELALKENAFVAASHMPLGRIVRDDQGVKFAAVA
jgi:glyoxylase-like metal-dependent hydrolase (beta-lactamase superfamily II)